MKYVTHALSPLLALTGSTVRDVVCYGSTELTPDRVGDHDNRFPVEVGLFRLRDSDVIGEVTISFFQTARPYTEGFAVYGTEMSIEWPEEVDGPLTVHELQPLDPHQPETGLRGRRSRTTQVHPEDRPESLPQSIRRFVQPYDLRPADGSPTVHRLAEHGGSHPFLVHEFLSAVTEDRPAAIDAPTAAAWTAPGIVAHRSAMTGGERLEVPDHR
jgi:predicted dehydrogenase